MRESRRERDYDSEEEEEPQRRGPMWPVILAVAGVLLFVGLVFFFLWNSVLLLDF